MEQILEYKGSPLTINVDSNDSGYKIAVNENEFELMKLFETGNELCVEINGENHTFYLATDRDNIYVFHNGEHYTFSKNDSSSTGNIQVGGAKGNFISSPMPGNIIKISCSEGDNVKENDTLVIVEAMKMENPLRSHIDGVVSKIHFAEGDLVEPGAPIVEIDSEED
jgi:biotin carboxyl carrier protein